MSARILATLVAAGLVAAAPAAPVLAQPETRGPHPITDFDAGRLSLAGVQIPVRVYHPIDVDRPMPVVAVIHGFLRNGSFMAELARTLASRGMVALVPDMPCGISGCDHDANAAQIRALIAWGVSESGRAGSALAGRVDATRRGAIGHSWGALSTLLASAQADGFEVAVLLDPNDDRGVGAMRAPSITKPTLLLTAEVLGNCNSAWDGGIFATIPPPRMRARIVGSAHCDAEEPSDALCPVGCGRGDPSKSSMFRRYAVAFVSCALQGDPAVAPWIDGGELMMDDGAGLVDRVSSVGLDGLACRRGAAPADAGAPSDPDGAIGPGAPDGSAGGDARASEDAAPVASDASAIAGGDAGTRADAGSTQLSSDGCSAVSATPLAALLGALTSLGLARRRRR